MIRATIEQIFPDGSVVTSSIDIDVQSREAMTYCTARIDAPDGHDPMLREVEVGGVPDGAGVVWVLGEVIRRAHAFAAEATEREW